MQGVDYQEIFAPTANLTSVHVLMQIAAQHDLAPVVQTLDSAIHRINLYPADSVIDFCNTYPLDSDLSGG